jgi:hypothetical protein
MVMILKRQYLTSEQVEYLEKVSTDRVNFSEHVRRAIDQYIERLKSEKQKKHKD